MRVGFFTDTYLPNRDGIVSHICQTRRILEGKGHKVFVFASGSGEDKRRNSDQGVFFSTSLPFVPYPQYKVAVFPLSAERKARKAGVEVVHSHGVATMGLAAVHTARSLKCGSVATFHTMIPDAAHYVSLPGLEKISRGALWKYVEWHYGLFDMLISPSEHAKRELQEHGLESVVVRSGVDAKKFRPDARAGERIKKRLGISGKKIALCLGRVAREKNIEFVLEAAREGGREGPDLAYVIAGKGPALEYYKEIGGKMGLGGKVLFPGFVEEKDLPAFYNCADVFVMPSSFETQGLSALEAMSCGVPACVLKGTATAEMVREGKNGFVFSSPEECAEKIMKAIDGRKKLSLQARKTGLENTGERTTEKLLEIYRKP